MARIEAWAEGSWASAAAAVRLTSEDTVLVGRKVETVDAAAAVLVVAVLHSFARLAEVVDARSCWAVAFHKLLLVVRMGFARDSGETSESDIVVIHGMM